MKLLNAFAIVAAFGLANVAYAQAQPPETASQADSSVRKRVGTTDPSAASSLPQREATSMTVPERTTSGGSEASAASSAHQRDAVSFSRGSDASATGVNAKWVSAIVGMKVETPAGAALGTVKDVVVDGYGQATHAIVSHGGLMGLGARYTAIPWTSVAQMLQGDRLLMDRAQLENAPMLSGAKPDVASAGWRREAGNYWRGKMAMGPASVMAPAGGDADAQALQSESSSRARN